MGRQLTIVIAALLALAGLAQIAVTLADGRDPLCRDFLAADGLNLPGLSEPECTRPQNVQAILEITYTVLADRVIETHKLLQQRYGVDDLRFICCYYGTGGDWAAYPIDNRHIFDSYLGRGATLASSIDIWVPAEGEDLSTFPEPLGALDGTVTITVSGI